MNSYIDQTTLYLIVANVSHSMINSPKMALRLVNRAFNAAVCDDRSWTETDRKLTDKQLKLEWNLAKNRGLYFPCVDVACPYARKVSITGCFAIASWLAGNLYRTCHYKVHMTPHMSEGMQRQENFYAYRLLRICKKLDKLTNKKGHTPQARKAARLYIDGIISPQPLGSRNAGNMWGGYCPKKKYNYS